MRPSPSSIAESHYGIKTKVVNALTHGIPAEYVRLDDDDGISGFVVANRFENESTLDRQAMIDEALVHADLSPIEQRQILMIAGLTPQEYEAVGGPIRVHKVKQLANAIEVILHGAKSDAAYVQGTLEKVEGVKTSKPKQVDGARGVLMSFRAHGTSTNPLTKEKAIGVLLKSRYNQIMPGA